MTQPEAQIGLKAKRLETVRVRLLGGFRVSVGSRSIAEDQWHLRKAAALVKLLILAPNHRLHREQIMDLLWPDSGRRAASNNLRRVLHAARKVLDLADGSRYLASEGEQLVLCPGSDLWVDVEAFEEAAATARRGKDPATYRAAIDLYAGELLPRDRYEEWTESHRRRLQETYLSLLIGLAGLYQERREYEPAIEVLRRVVLSEEPTLEEAHAGLMRLYALLGREGAAFSQYQRLRDVLSKQLGTEPSSTTHRLHEDITSGKFPTTRNQAEEFSQEEGEPETKKHNLPAPRSRFVGRERELIEIKRTLTMTRLLTLTGVGGSGKTRLALEVTRSLVGAYPDGVWLVELASLSEGELIPQAVAEALGVHETPNQPLTDTLKEVLGPKKMLLILDNCEHLVEGAALIVDVLLSACPRLCILATSREALNVEGELVWPVPALTVPDPERSSTVRELEGFESVRLFLERALLRRPDFSLVAENAQPLAEICRTLEGIPLAIELAAARIRTLSVRVISERLTDSLKLLTGGARTQTPRQRTLRGTLDWSYDLLSEPERVLFRRLSVFAGGWTLEASEPVGAGGGVEVGEVLDLLSELVEKSLVIAQPTAQGKARYKLLEPIRQYALEKLEDSGEVETVRQEHALYFLALAEKGELELRGPQTTVWLGRLETEHNNLRAALTWSLKGGSPRVGLLLSSAMWMYWRTRGYLSEASQWLEEALAGDGTVELAARAGALRGLGYVLKEQNELQRSEVCFKEALTLYEELGEKVRVADSLASLGWVAQYQRDVARAKAFFEQSLATARDSGNEAVIPSILNGMAFVAREGGDFGRAQELWSEALSVAREQGDIFEAATILKNMGYTELARDEHERSAELIEEALMLGREIGNKVMVTDCLAILGIAAALRGDAQRAKALLQESLASYMELGLKANVPESLEGLAEGAGALGEGVRAARLWGAAEALRETFGISWTLAERILHEPQLDAARSTLDKAAWQAAFSEGKAMPLEEMVGYALSGNADSDEPDPRVSANRFAEEQSAGLTPREQEVVALVAKGLTNRQIAARLVIAESTAETHLARIFKKLGVRSRTQLTVWANDRGLSSSS